MKTQLYDNLVDRYDNQVSYYSFSAFVFHAWINDRKEIAKQLRKIQFLEDNDLELLHIIQELEE
jgi:hypothetical protein